METMSSVSEFMEFRKRILRGKGLRDVKPCLVICAGTGGQASGANDLLRIVKRYILEHNLQEAVSLRITGCQGFCEMDPFILVEPGGQLYPRLSMDDVPEVIDAVVRGEVVERLLYQQGERRYREQGEIPFFKGQTRLVLGMNRHIDPIRILDYLEHGGYGALEKVLARPDPGWIIEQIKRSGLRGRGGAGFSTGAKWEMARNARSRNGQKFIVCNADEGDPGAYMDRSLLEGNPHAIIEGMIIAGIAIGASQGFIYVRSEYPLAIKHALIALRQARDLGLLGRNVLGTGLDFGIDIVRGAGAFVCGEETALIRSIEGKIGEPRQRPPYPIEKGIRGQPTCINNVETLANVPVILTGGADAYAKVGVPGSTGTKIFSLVGKIKNTGLVEVPLGMTLAEVVYEIGGGPKSEAKIKAVQTGGPSGGCIPSGMFDLPITYESLSKAGSIMGSGGMIVMDENTCMVDLARYFMGFLKDESCGKCFTCRKGTQRMYELLEDICKGRGHPEHLDLLEELALAVKDTTMCGLGQSAPNPVLSTLRYFRNEYLEHIRNKRCGAGVCSDLVGAPCQSACPLGTEVWKYAAHIARKEYTDAYLTIRAPNPLPSTCARVCNHPCEAKCKSGTTGAGPIGIRNLKRFVVDNIDPDVFKRARTSRAEGKAHRVAVVGAGPAGLAAAHALSLRGHEVTIFEAETQPGGMLICGIPAYRLPRDVLRKEIDALMDENVTLRCGVSLGRDFTLDGLLDEGFRAVFLAIGAHKSQSPGIEGEHLPGVVQAVPFLKAFNLQNRSLAHGRVVVVGGGNSAVDSARVALRQEHVNGVTIVYRRTRDEMPAYPEEIEESLREGVELRTLTAPAKVLTREGRVTGLQCIETRLGEHQKDGRRRPVPVPGTEHAVPADTIIIAVGDQPDTEGLVGKGLQVERSGRIEADPETTATGRPGVFAGGDVVTGPNTVVAAIAAGYKAAAAIGRYLDGLDLHTPAKAVVPTVFIEPVEVDETESRTARRATPPMLPLESRKHNLQEVEQPLSEEAAIREARRCLRCDLDFTRPGRVEADIRAEGGKQP